jgi:Flp pilus assembly protein TadG
MWNRAKTEALARAKRRERQKGQVLVLFVFTSFVIIGMVAVVIDVAWFWTNQQQMQRAADAGALAGAVYLPGDRTSAYAAARAEATKNGYTSGVAGVTVTPEQDSGNSRRLRVTITGPVEAYFARVFCAITSCTEQAAARVVGLAEFVLPVPMGSPQNYFGVGYLVDATTSSSTSSASSVRTASTAVSGGGWSGTGNVYANDNAYSTASSNNATQQWGTFGFDSSLPASASITGIQVRLNDLFMTESVSGTPPNTDCHVHAELSWNGGSSWSTQLQTSGTLSTSTSADYIVGSSSGTTGWGSHSWTRSDLLNANFRVRLVWHEGSAACGSDWTVNLDHLQVEAFYSTTSTSITTAHEDVLGPYGGVLTPHNFWAAMNSQGAPNIQGDAYLTHFETRTSATNDDDDTDPDGRYAPDEFYNYGVEIPAGGTGELWIYDPGFCEAGSTGLGTGEFWTLGAPNGYSTRQPISAYFALYDTHQTPWNDDDDTLVVSSGDTFERSDYQDHTLFQAAGGTPTQPNCRDLSWHHNWWQLADNLTGGKTYRLHTYSTDPNAATDQDNSTGHNTFAFWARSTSGSPRIYGIGAMEAFVRLPGGTSSEFYLAQIDAVHAGKTMIIDLWDPGDTGALSASLEILKPTASGYVPATFDYTAFRESAAGSSCDSRTGTNVSSVTTNTGGSSLYNGCWLTIQVRLPADYDAPHPSSDSVTDEGGWWKIRYSMGGSSSSYSTDLTTWQVSIRGSPVHLVPV